MRRLYRWWLAPLYAIATAACADAAVTGARPGLTPGPDQPVYSAECDPSVPCFNSPEEVPAEWKPKIYSAHPVVYWNHGTAVASSRMYYYGNYAEEELTLTITGPSNGTETVKTASRGGFLPGNYSHTTPGFTFTPSTYCGHRADLASDHFATITVWVTRRGLGSTTVKAQGGDDASQPDCSCGVEGGGPDEEGVQSIGSSPDVSTSSECTGGGGGPGGEATPYTCYTVITDYYWYYPDTGTYEYRYSEETTWCEENEA